MYITLRRVVLSLPTKDETPEEFEQTVMIGHAATGTPQSATSRPRHHRITPASVPARASPAAALVSVCRLRQHQTTSSRHSRLFVLLLLLLLLLVICMDDFCCAVSFII